MFNLNTFVDSSAVAGVLMMVPAVDNSWIGKLLTARTNVKEMTDDSYTCTSNSFRIMFLTFF